MNYIFFVKQNCSIAGLFASVGLVGARNKHSVTGKDIQAPSQEIGETASG